MPCELRSSPRPATTPGRARHGAARLLVGVLAATSLVALPAAGASAQSASGSLQGEAMAIRSSLGRVITDRSAQEGKALQVHSRASARGVVDADGTTDLLVVRVRGEQCDGAPRLRVAVDGAVVTTRSVTSTAWREVRLRVSAASGDRRVELSFVNDHLTRRCDRNLQVDAVRFTTEAPAVTRPAPTAPPASAPAAPPAPVPSAAPVPAPAPVPTRPPSPAPTPSTAPAPTPSTATARDGLLFDAAVGRQGLSAFASTQNANRITVVDDPVLGAQRQVMRLTVFDTDDTLTGNPRAQAETAKFWDEGEEHYVGVSYYFPADWPVPQDTRQWVNLGEVYGPPYAGASPNALFVKRTSSGGQVIAWQRNGTYGWDRPFEVPLVRGRWHDFVFRIKLSQDPGQGFWEAWSNTGSGWQRLQLHGRDRLYSQTVDASNDGGANYHKVAHYRSKGMWPVATLYVADHRVGDSFAAVAPSSHSS